MNGRFLRAASARETGSESLLTAFQSFGSGFSWRGDTRRFRGFLSQSRRHRAIDPSAYIPRTWHCSCSIYKYTDAANRERRAPIYLTTTAPRVKGFVVRTGFTRPQQFMTALFKKWACVSLSAPFRLVRAVVRGAIVKPAREAFVSGKVKREDVPAIYDGDEWT